MTVDRVRPTNRLTRTAIRRITLVLGLTLSLPSVAQDNNRGDCPVNADGESMGCPGIAPTVPMGQYPRDWVPIAEVPESLRDRECINCQGRYIDPLAAEDTSVEPDTADINAWANRTELQGSKVYMTGGVTANQGYRHLRADNVEIDRIDESALLTGDVYLREPGVLLQGERAEIFSHSGEATIDNGKFVFHQEHLRGTADFLMRDSEGLVYIDEGNFSFCSPEENDWAIRSEALKLDFAEGLATARNAKIEVEGFPVFYTPWLQFPLDDRRRTGFLWPNFGNDSTGGLDITVPVYFNLAPNYDALYAPRFIEERGVNHELELRYFHPLLGNWSAGGAWMQDDDRYAEQEPMTRSTDRWLGVVRQDGLFQQRWRSHIDYSKASDVDYLKDLETTNLDSQRSTSLLQLGSMDYLGDRWLLNLEARQYQSLADDINEDYEKMPQFTAVYWGAGSPFALEPVLQAQVSNFDTEEERVTGQRLYSEAGLTYPMRWMWGFLKPTVKYRQINYDLSETFTFPDDSPSAGAPLANLDGGLFFERQTALAGRGLMQTLEPRIYYLYSDYEQQDDQPDFDSAELTFSYNQLFRQTRFSGHDRIDDANQLSVGVTTRFIDGEDGRSLLSASIGEIFYFRDRKVRLFPGDPPLDDSGSEIAGELHFTPDDHLSVRTSLIFDPYDGDMNSGHFQSGYRTDGGAIFNLGYSYRRPNTTLANVITQPPTDEANVSGYLPLGNNWSIYAAMNYSLEANRSVEDMAGVEYDTCCWTLRLLYLRYYNNVSGQTVDFDDPDLERENTAQFQIILKGMGGFGDRITDIMEDMIRGYEERTY